MDRASRPRVRVHGAPSERGITGPARRSRVLARRGDERHGKSVRAPIPRLVLRGRARARVRRRGGETNERESAPFSLFDVSLSLSLRNRVGRNARASSSHSFSTRRPQSRRDHPLNLSILLSGGKETNQDFLSSGERTGRSPAPNPAVPPQGNVVFGRVRLSRGVASRPSPS